MSSTGSDESKKNADEGSIPMPEPPNSSEHPEQKDGNDGHAKDHDAEFSPHKGIVPTSNKERTDQNLSD
ncbi:MAG: hypothetical protein CYPHOPRED_004134 [Cyphobasidiales sp. Tagirdzhanova-0007]|nr:MAG: hypothetical protein CYPHOPRED_004134 [Cyphobasidiales sp. Tagirdzhanova-0007]